MKKETNELKKRIEELENQLKRALADYQNLEKRVLAERSEWIKTANRELILRILPILDTLILAYRHGQRVNLSKAIEPIFSVEVTDENLGMVIKQFEDVLRGAGVTKIETFRKTFDPNLMEAVTTIEGEENKVVEEVRAGYLLNDRVLRVARVKVGKVMN